MLELVRRPRSAALAFLVGGAFWFVIGALYGFTTAIHLVAPDFFNDLGWLNFGRTRPIHVNTMVFGFVSSTLVGAALYYVPALLRVKLWSEKLAWIAFLLWTITVTSGLITFSTGHSQGREYAEYLWPFDVMMVIVILLLLFDLIMTTATRREPTLYISVWYVFAMLLTMTGVYPMGNVMWHPPEGALGGLLDSIFLWFYGHNLVGLLLTPLALGAAYFIIPRVTRAPLYSHTLSLVGFWALIGLYTHIGGHHLLQTPIPSWLKTISVVNSVSMLIPVSVALMNLWLTARGRMGALWHDQGGRLVLSGTLWYAVTCIQGPLQSLPTVQRVTHLNNWTIGHAHIAVLGFSGFIALGALWHLLPEICGRRLYSQRLVSLQFGLILIGLMGFFLVLSAAGLVQGEAWVNGEVLYRTLPTIRPYMGLRVMLGLFILTGAVLGFHNLVMTIWRGEPLPAAEMEPPLPSTPEGVLR